PRRRPRRARRAARGPRARRWPGRGPRWRCRWRYSRGRGFHGPARGTPSRDQGRRDGEDRV
ncbi:MAG: hypothetical protein AVDCRST_MAG54-4516, partial [uncultured Actinomycetospora sp.]